MFGEKKLLREGVEGRAVVLKADYRTDRMGSTARMYRVELRVQLGDGSTAEFHTKLDREKVGEYRQADIVAVRYDASDHSKLAVDVPALEVEFQRSQAAIAAEKASKIASAEAKLAGAAAQPSGGTTLAAQEVPAGDNRAAAVEFLKSAMHEMSAAGAAQDPIEERLTKLQHLRDTGVLSAEEYEAQRQRILQSM
jgi:hypothetical protein